MLPAGGVVFGVMCSFVGQKCVTLWAKSKSAVLKGQIDDILIRNKKYRDPRFSAGKLAEMLGVSGWTLSRIVRKEYGMRYAELVHGCRIKEAMRHLRDKRFAAYSVDDIGAMVGFGNRQSFFSAFKQIAGMTPEKYRMMV